MSRFNTSQTWGRWRFGMAILALSQPCFSQEVLRSFSRAWDDGCAGFRWLGDINGDGCDDFLASEVFYAGETMPGAGRVRAVSGSNEEPLYTFFGSEANELLGTALGALDDVNGDGVPDFAGSSPTQGFLWSGFDGSVIDRIAPFFGIKSFDDLDGDGRTDLLYRPWAEAEIRVYAGGQDLFSVSGLADEINSNSVGFGLSFEVVGDVDADGVSDFAVGAPGSPSDTICVNGRVFVFSGASGTRLYDLEGDSPDALFGSSIVGVGDITGDGIPDFAVSAPECCNVFCDTSGGGRVSFFEGRRGRLIENFDAHAPPSYTNAVRLGSKLLGVGDLDGNGFDDVLASFLSSDGGVINHHFVALDGSSRKPIYSIIDTTPTFTRLGALADVAGDVDGDGFPDFILSECTTGSTDDRMLLFSGAPRGVRTIFCSELRRNERPRIGVTGVPVRGERLPIHVSGVMPHRQAILALGSLKRPRFRPLARRSTCWLAVEPSAIFAAQTREIRPGDGVATVEVRIPYRASILGELLYAQWIVEDQSGFWMATPILEIEIQPGTEARVDLPF